MESAGNGGSYKTDADDDWNINTITGESAPVMP